MSRYSPLLYPPPIGPVAPPVATLTEEMAMIYEYQTALPTAHRIPLTFETPIALLIRISSRVGNERGWRRAGYLAQVLNLLPGDPKKQVCRLYLDDKYLTLSGDKNPFYLEFWAYAWLADYHLQLWGKRVPESRALEIE